MSRLRQVCTKLLPDWELTNGVLGLVFSALAGGLATVSGMHLRLAHIGGSGATVVGALAMLAASILLICAAGALLTDGEPEEEPS